MKKLVVFLNLTAMCAVMALPLAAQGNRADQGRGPEFVPGEMLVQFKGGTDESEVNRVLGRVNGHAAEVVRSARANRNGGGDLVLARFPNMIAFEAARRDVESEYSVEFAERNWIYTHSVNTNDTYYASGQLWGMYGAASSPANQFGSGAGAAASNNCSNVWVGIIDEGYMYSHVDLAANAGTNPGEIAGNGLDDDGNGYVDDVYGWDFDGNNSSVFDGTGDDHGTHVAGTIGGVGNNGIGVAGVCHSVKMMGAKFLGSRGGTTANAVKAVDYFTDLKTRHSLNFVATNNSWGGGGFSQALSDAIGRANNANILFVAAAGNSAYNCDSGSSCYPAEYTNANIISVASITSTGGLSSFSSYGATTIDVCAPGSSIISTVPATSGKGKNATITSGYASYSGTSMATPHVAGAAALYKARYAGASAADIKSAIMGSATPTASCNGRVVSNGRLNVSSF